MSVRSLRSCEDETIDQDGFLDSLQDLEASGESSGFAPQRAKVSIYCPTQKFPSAEQVAAVTIKLPTAGRLQTSLFAVPCLPSEDPAAALEIRIPPLLQNLSDLILLRYEGLSVLSPASTVTEIILFTPPPPGDDRIREQGLS